MRGGGGCGILSGLAHLAKGIAFSMSMLLSQGARFKKISRSVCESSIDKPDVMTLP